MQTKILFGKLAIRMTDKNCWKITKISKHKSITNMSLWIDSEGEIYGWTIYFWDEYINVIIDREENIFIV